MAEKESRLNKIVDSTIARICTLLLFAVIVTAYGWMKRSFLTVQTQALCCWLKSEHTITTTGWYWVYCFSLPFFCPLLIFLFIRRIAFHKYGKKETVLKILAEWVVNNQDDLEKGKVVRFRAIDIQNRLKRRSARKYLKTIIDNHKNLKIDFSDKETAYIGSRQKLED